MCYYIIQNIIETNVILVPRLHLQRLGRWSLGTNLDPGTFAVTYRTALRLDLHHVTVSLGAAELVSCAFSTIPICPFFNSIHFSFTCTYIGIAIFFVFSPYIWKFTSCFQFQVNLTFNDFTAQNMSKVIYVPNISLNYHFLAKFPWRSFSSSSCH